MYEVRDHRIKGAVHHAKHLERAELHSESNSQCSLLKFPAQVAISN